MCPRSVCRREASHIRPHTLEAVSIFYFKTSRPCVWEEESGGTLGSEFEYIFLPLLLLFLVRLGGIFYVAGAMEREGGGEEERERESRDWNAYGDGIERCGEERRKRWGG